MGEGMRGFRIALAAATIAALTASAQAQMQPGSMTTNRQADRPGGAPPPPLETPHKRANEKDYKSSLDRLPDQKYDPWAKTR